jgi:hypothetical protein
MGDSLKFQHQNHPAFPVSDSILALEHICTTTACHSDYYCVALLAGVFEWY